MGRNTLGALEQSVMMVVLALGEGAYGVAIRDDLSRRTQRDHSIGAVYTTLDRLVAKGLVESFQGEATPVRGGRAKRFFTLTPNGSEALKRAFDAQRQLGDALGGTVLPDVGGAL